MDRQTRGIQTLEGLTDWRPGQTDGLLIKGTDKLETEKTDRLEDRNGLERDRQMDKRNGLEGQMDRMDQQTTGMDSFFVL